MSSPRPAGSASAASSMEAVRFAGPGDVRWERIPREQAIGAGRVRVRVLAAGICGSDLHVYETGIYVTQIPVTMGHEYCGEVLETGPGVTGLSPGDRVVGDSRVPCGRCSYCAAGMPNLCTSLGYIGEVRDGAFAGEIVIEADRLVKIEASVPPEVAALAEPVAVCLHALGLAGPLAAGEAAPPAVSPAARVLVLGGGPVGALLATALRVREGLAADVVETAAFRRKVLAGLPVGRVLAEPDGLYELLFDTTGSPGPLQRLLPAHLARHGRAVVLGLFREPFPFDFTALVESEWLLRGCAAFSDELPAAARMLESEWRRFEPAVTHRLPLREAPQAFRMLASPTKEAMKVVLIPEKN
jgi:(R,R)-butanediol dehydrogenase/meso-butanediol dehydrogenase/diacetyl reductase